MDLARRKRAGADGGFMAMQLHAGETAGPRTAEWPNPIPLLSRSHPTSGPRVPTTDLLRASGVFVDPFSFVGRATRRRPSLGCRRASSSTLLFKVVDVSAAFARPARSASIAPCAKVVDAPLLPTRLTPVDPFC